MFSLTFLCLLVCTIGGYSLVLDSQQVVSELFGVDGEFFILVKQINLVTVYSFIRK